AVTGYDVRSAVAEQVRSLGAQFLELEAGKGAEGEGGYARELTDEEKAAQQRELTDAITEYDVVITTALVPGRPAPRLVTADAVERMKPGAVVVDLAGEAGGNCELSEPGETVVRHDVTIAAPPNSPSTMAEHASQLHARNVQSLPELMPRPAAGHRRRGRADEAGRRGGRPGRRGGRQLRALRAGGDRGAPRRDDRRAAEFALDHGRARLAALRAQRPVAAGAHDRRPGSA